MAWLLVKEYQLLVKLLLVFVNSFYKKNQLTSKDIILLMLVFRYFFPLDNFLKRLNNKVLVNNLFLTLLCKLNYLRLLLPYTSYYC